MTTINLFRVPQALTGAAIGATLLFGGVQGASASGLMSNMDNMEGMDHGAPTSTFAFGEPAKPATAVRTVKITMKEMSFEPAILKVKTGETIHFVVTNNGEVDHDFTIGDTAAQTAHRKEMAEMADMGGDMHHDDDPNAISVKAGRTRDLTWKFTRAGTLEFDCNIPGHYEAGMKGVIAVAGQTTNHAKAKTPIAPRMAATEGSSMAAMNR